MNKEQLKGKIRNLKGRAKEAAGALTGNKKRQAEGMAERVAGAGQEKVGQAEEKLARDTDRSHKRPHEETPRSH